MKIRLKLISLTKSEDGNKVAFTMQAVPAGSDGDIATGALAVGGMNASDAWELVEGREYVADVVRCL